MADAFAQGARRGVEKLDARTGEWSVKLWIMSLSLLAGLGITNLNTSAQEPGLAAPIIARGATREQIQSTPLLERPNRPLHVYGNTVRRRYHRSSARG
jgi:hypothetical protein